MWDALKSIDWGDAPGWVAAIGTVGTLIAAVWGLLYELRQRRNELLDRQAAQARLITVAAERSPLFGVVISVTNHSAAPIFAVQVQGLRMTPTEPVTCWARGETGEWLEIGPGAKKKASLLLLQEPREPDTQFSYVKVSASDSFTADVEFVDAAGFRWSRSGPHAPVRQTTTPLVPPKHIAPLLQMIEIAPPAS